MAITYTNRKDRTYTLCRKLTKNGKFRYNFYSKPIGEPIDHIPEGYEIVESVNGRVSLSKILPRLLLDEEIKIVESTLEKHPRSRRYCTEVKSNRITIYEQLKPDFDLISKSASDDMGFTESEIIKLYQFMDAKDTGEYVPVLKFVLRDSKQRLFVAYRMSLLTQKEEWISISIQKSIKELANTIIPRLGAIEFLNFY